MTIVSGETNFSKSDVSPNIWRNYFSKFHVSSNIRRNYFSKSYVSPNIMRKFSETSEPYFKNGFADHLGDTSFAQNTNYDLYTRFPGSCYNIIKDL
jgi:hypothetical protein